MSHTPSYMCMCSSVNMYNFLTAPPDMVLHVCIHYDLEHFVHGTQCVFSKLLQDWSGYTALIQACYRGHTETVRVLLDHGANVDQQDNVRNRT